MLVPDPLHSLALKLLTSLRKPVASVSRTGRLSVRLIAVTRMLAPLGSGWSLGGRSIGQEVFLFGNVITAFVGPAQFSALAVEGLQPAAIGPRELLGLEGKSRQSHRLSLVMAAHVFARLPWTHGRPELKNDPSASLGVAMEVLLPWHSCLAVI